MTFIAGIKLYHSNFEINIQHLHVVNKIKIVLFILFISILELKSCVNILINQ